MLLAVQRLKTRAQFQAVLAGERVASTTHFALHRCGLQDARTGTVPVAGHVPPPLFAEPPAVWLGAMVPKRWARRAVTRNAIKRQIHAVAGMFEDRLPTAAHLVRLRSSFDRKHFVSATSDALKLAVRLELQQLMARAATAPRVGA